MVVLSVHMSGIGLKFSLIASLPWVKLQNLAILNFLDIFAHNVNIPGNLEKFSGILFSQNGSV